MEPLSHRQEPENDLLSLFVLPLEIGSRMYDAEDLEEQGIPGLLEGLSADTQRILLQHARTLISIKPELGYHFLFKSKALLERMELSSLEEWVSLVLDIFDVKGLNPAKEFILELDRHPLFAQYWGKGVSFHEVNGILGNYVHALGHRDFHLEPSSVHYTDTMTIYLPERISTFPMKEDNALLYKMMVTHKFLQAELGTYRLNPEKIPPIETAAGSEIDANLNQTKAPLLRFFNLFPDPVLAEDLFNLMETIRIEAWIEAQLPGLFRQMKRIKKEMGMKRPDAYDLPGRSRIMEDLVMQWLGNFQPLKETDVKERVRKIRRFSSLISRPDATVQDTACAVTKAFRTINEIPGAYKPIAPVSFMGVLKPEDAERGRQKRREATRVRFREELAKMIEDFPQCEQVEIEIPGTDDAHSSESKTPPQQQIPHELLLDGNPVPIPEGMRKIITEIYEDLGAVPSAYTAIADDMSGHSFRSLCQTPTGTSNVLSEHGKDVHVYDEWDYRRKGYRKRWVLLRQSDATSGDPAFANNVLERYRGMIQTIKRQFERIQTAQRLLKKQKEGDRVDLDAAIEALADGRAGLTPSERLFSQIRRDRRDIATAFLIDLSGSTKGWINDMERTALLILCEGLQVLKDRFAIYGFSGRTRKRCELFRIKGIEEAYGETVRERISGLSPLDYTRMGPPIRHVTGILRRIEARTRLMITLSDGKPDDYDIYKGSYGIEDTRQALLESREADIHHFCITIDKAEHSYLSHMYGPANYVFIDDIAKLPVRIPEIYRKLTT